MRTMVEAQTIRPATRPTSDWPIEVFYDGACPLCRREVAFLRRRDRRGRIRFTDIAAPGFAPAQYGKSQDEFLAQIHGRLPGGAWLTGVEVFRRLYAAIGFSWLVAPTRLPLVAPLLEWGYRHFARHRLRLTGRCGDAARACRVPPPGAGA